VGGRRPPHFCYRGDFFFFSDGGSAKNQARAYFEIFFENLRIFWCILYLDLGDPSAVVQFGGAVLREVHAVGNEEPRNTPQVFLKR
jgi:hypothetical protein